MTRQKIVPTASYRLQLGPHLDLHAAAQLVDDLADLGVSHLYLSPVFKARAGSTHGYDVVDHSVVDPQLGGDDALRALAARTKTRGLGLILDLVPNHMCIASADNLWWMDVLENGPGSPYARCFDVDWNPPKPDLLHKVLLPVLGDQYGRVLENGELRLARLRGAFRIHYYDWTFPVAPRSFDLVLRPALRAATEELGADHGDVLELASILTGISYLPARTETDEARVRERRREKEVVKGRLARLTDASPAIAAAVDATVAAINGARGDSRSFDRLEALLAEQAYRLCYWRVAADEINYRRFFDVNELAALRVELPEVFEAVHRLPFALFKEGLVDGFRLDHVDGLYDPAAYLARLPPAAFVVVEKILGEDERLREDWPVDGTTGYEQLRRLDAVLTDGSSQETLLVLHARLTGHEPSWPETVYESKKLVLEVALSGELTVLASRLDRISEQHRFSRDFTLNSLQQALAEVIACFPVYRTYVTADGALVPEDRRHIQAALRDARWRNPALSGSIFDFIGSVLLLEHPGELDDTQRAARLEFVLRFQQITGPVTAKGVEDTAFYRFAPLVSASEVGGDPATIGMTLERFHAENVLRARTGPHSLSATATHDTKRGEDLRMRVALLAEDVGGWESAARRWRALNAEHRALLHGRPAPDDFDEYLLYQTLVGMWPAGGGPDRAATVARVQAYMVKAAREAKRRTSWVSPDSEYERASTTFVAAILASEAFVRDLERFTKPLLLPAAWTSAGRALLKATCPGIPDFYQGTESNELSLVDPDNRRPVDFSGNQALLRELMREHAADPLALAERLRADTDGGLKLLVTWRALGLRARCRALFESGAYVPVEVAGPNADHVIAFERRAEGAAALVVVSRFPRRRAQPPFGAKWTGDSLVLGGGRPRSWRDAITDQVVEGPAGALSLHQVLAHLPFAALQPLE